MGNIEILKEKIRKAPNSKLFLPLAEAYKEQGLIDESINVLLEGLARQPEYHSARVALGKAYLRKNMLAEAQAEFEKVVAVVPDNLFAHKKLMGIYYNNGDFDKLEKVCKVILALNEDDEEASTMLYAISKSQEKEEIIEQQWQEQEEEVDHPNEQAYIDEDKEGISSVQDEKKSEEESHYEVDPSSFNEEEIESIATENAESKDNIDKIEVPEEKHVILPTETMADICITQGLYHEAMRIYESILSKDPDNKKLLQRRSELKTLLDLIELRKKEYTVKKLSRVAKKIKDKSRLK